MAMMHPDSRPEFPTPARRRPVVVCIDDDPAVLRSLRRLLPDEGYDLVTTTDPEEALDRVQRVPVDVFIADQRMPGIAGTDLLRLVERQSPRTRRVILSAYPDPTGFLRSGESLVQHFIPKPWNDSLLRAIVNRITGEQPRETAIRPDSFMKEIPILAECTKQRVLHLVPGILRVFRKARRERRSVLVLLEGLPLLADDPGALLADLELGATTAGVNLALIDQSGLAARYRRLRGSPSPLVTVHGPDPAKAGPSWLLVDTAPARRVFLKLLLEGLGMTCRAAGSAEEARRLVRSEAFDRILVDLSDPQEIMEWIEEISQFRGRSPVTPLLPTGRTWEPMVFDRWNLSPPLTRPYSLRDFVGLKEAIA
jgi:CheY-like chemotaxis protein